MLNLQMQAACFDYIKSAEGNQEILRINPLIL